MGVNRMPVRRTDLAVEAHEIWQESTAETTALEGVEARDSVCGGCGVHTVTILDERGARELNKPVGRYITVTLPDLRRRGQGDFENGVTATSQQLGSLLPSDAESVLVVGLGNQKITPDAVGPLTVEHTMVTKHLIERHPEFFGQLRPVTAFTPGVLASTGMESADILRGVIEKAKPDCVLVIDALASRKLSRLCSTVQICDTGITPGSGVGNSRAEMNQASLGVPVIAIGVPTVVDAGTLAADLLEEAGQDGYNPDAFGDYGGSLIVTPKDIDSLVAEAARIVGYGINLALHEGFGIQDVRGFLS